MKQIVLLALPVICMVACTQEIKSSEQITLKAQQEKAMIDRGVQSLRIASFYVPGPAEVLDQKANITAESMTSFVKKSKLYQADDLIKQPVNLAGLQYQTFVKTNADDPHLGQFKRETAAKILTQNQLLSVADRAYFTNELIINRSHNLALMNTSLLSLRGKIGSAEHDNMIMQVQQLMDQYEKHYIVELATNEDKPATTYRQRAGKALDNRFAELALQMIRENRQLLETNFK